MSHSKSNSPWIAGLSSFVLHLALLLLMAIWTIAGSSGVNRHAIEGGLANDTDESLETVQIDLAQQPKVDSVPEVVVSVNDLPSNALEPTLGKIESTVTETGDSPSLVEKLTGGFRSTGESEMLMTTSLAGRKNRKTVGKENGASDASEAAVEAALAYLARHQMNNGSWSVRFDQVPCNGECDHGGAERDPHQIAATGLALLCFMGAGHTLSEGEYREEVSRGVYYLVQNLKIRYGKGTWLNETASKEMYEHGIATLALCEALQMTGDTSLKESCQAAINFIVSAQFEDGGWNYHPAGPGDLSIVGWQVMALKSAFSAKLDVPPETIRRVDKFLRQHQSGDFMFRYRASVKPSASMTSIGVLMKILRGMSKTDPSIQKAMEYFVRVWPEDRGDVYFSYYASQALFHYGGKPWSQWNPQVRDFLVQTQEQNGHMAGSWWFPKNVCSPMSHFTNELGGRLYVTAMACLTLEVYYRNLPVYNRVEEEFKF